MVGNRSDSAWHIAGKVLICVKTSFSKEVVNEWLPPFPVGKEGLLPGAMSLFSCES